MNTTYYIRSCITMLYFINFYVYSILILFIIILMYQYFDLIRYLMLNLNLLIIFEYNNCYAENGYLNKIQFFKSI